MTPADIRKLADDAANIPKITAGHDAIEDEIDGTAFSCAEVLRACADVLDAGLLLADQYDFFGWRDNIAPIRQALARLEALKP